MSSRRASGPPLPVTMQGLPTDHAGRPVPWFVATLPDGRRDPRVADAAKMTRAVGDRLCWVCGHPRGSFQAFVIGPMCAVNRISAEPPCHRGCAEYSALACPFLNTPQMVRRQTGLPEPASGQELGRVDPPGIMITRNPGVTVVWVTRRHTVRQLDGGMLFELGDPVATACYARGAPATAKDVLESLESGLPLLEAAAAKDPDPAAAHRALSQDYARALQLLVVHPPARPEPEVVDLLARIPFSRGEGGDGDVGDAGDG